MVNEYKKLFINAHIFTMRFQGDRDPLLPRPPRKKMIHMNTKLLDHGNSWSSLGYLPKTLNIKASTTGSLKPAKTTDKSPNTSKQGPKLFLFFGRQNRFCFLRIILRVETISMVSSNETLPNMQCTGHIAPDPQEAHLSCTVLCPCGTLFGPCTQVCQPLSFLCQV